MNSFLKLEVLELVCASGQRSDEVKGKTKLGINNTVDVC